MHVYDIEDAISDNDPSGLQHAFRVLVAFPRLGHIEGLHSATRLDKLFGDVIVALLADQATMPEELVRMLHEVTSVSFDPQSSYAQGAIVVFESREHWQHRFMSEMANMRRRAPA